MAAAVALPHHQLYESPDSRGIDVFDWTIRTSTKPISNARDLDILHAELGGIPLPEMTFGSNVLTLEHRPSGWKYSFIAKGALGAVKNGQLEEGDGGVRVGYAEKWLESRSGPSPLLPMPETVQAKPYDWTYTTLYTGHECNGESPTEMIADPSSSKGQFTPADPELPSHAIPMAELMRQDPIMFYAEIPIFESELDDNGSASYLVRIRVMPTCIFILGRFTLRVDGVLFRIHDTRMYHSFASNPPLVIRETGGWEAPYERVKRQLPKRNDLTPLTDPNWIARILTGMPKEVSQQEGANTRWRGLGSKVEIAHLLPQPAPSS